MICTWFNISTPRSSAFQNLLKLKSHITSKLPHMTTLREQLGLPTCLRNHNVFPLWLWTFELKYAFDQNYASILQILSMTVSKLRHLPFWTYLWPLFVSDIIHTCSLQHQLELHDTSFWSHVFFRSASNSCLFSSIISYNFSYLPPKTLIFLVNLKSKPSNTQPCSLDISF